MRLYPRLLVGLLMISWCSSLRAAHIPGVRELRTQRVGETMYFHVRFDKPHDLRLPTIDNVAATEWQRRKLSRVPQLVPQDDQSWAVYPRVDIPLYRPVIGFDADLRKQVPIEGLEFVGKVSTPPPDKSKFLLLYPTGGDLLSISPSNDRDHWTEAAVEIEWGKTSQINSPSGRKIFRQIAPRDDLERLWAEGQAARLAILEVLAPDFSFHGFACAATGRKYGVLDPMFEPEQKNDREKIHKHLYETTTGSAAITESLQLHRMLNRDFRDDGQRVVDVSKVQGVTIAEHPWQKMMVDKKPDPEPLAKWVPHDNFYVHFKDIRKFIEFGELLDEWGTNVTRAYEMTSRDFGMKERYEQQLCLRSSWAGKTFGPAVIRSLAFTGSDGYLREGSDLTILFHVKNRDLFLAGVEPFLQEACKKFGGQLKEGKSDHRGVTVESFVTPLREVSLHRAMVDDFVIYANSRVGLERVLDTHKGLHRSLADSLDFQYMRTVFRLSDDEEDGFAFFSDAFIRQLVGPASKIKARRRLEALTSLQMVTNAALFHAWETGKLPANQQELLKVSALRPEEIFTPEGRGVAWDAKQQAAVSDVYNTMHFPTPLVELPIDLITKAEEAEYLQFRQEYLNLWRQFFDPVGMRVSLRGKKIKMETYILPLIRDSRYDILRQVTALGTTNLDPDRINPKTLVQGTLNISAIHDPIEQWVFHGKVRIGDQATLSLDDGREFQPLLESFLRYDLDRNPIHGNESIFSNMPLVLGVRVKDAAKFEEGLEALAKENWMGVVKREKLPSYKGVTITRAEMQNEVRVLYHALIDDFWFVSPKLDCLKARINRSADLKAGKVKVEKAEPTAINASLYAAPRAFVESRPALDYWLEWETHKRALVNGPIWYPLYRGGLIADKTTAQEKETLARRFLGFVPVSPDGTEYRYDRHTGEVVNERHGSSRMRHQHKGIATDSPLARLLQEFRTLRVDLRFREDGVHTTVTWERGGKQP